VHVAGEVGDRTRTAGAGHEGGGELHTRRPALGPLQQATHLGTGQGQLAPGEEVHRLVGREGQIRRPDLGDPGGGGGPQRRRQGAGACDQNQTQA
jgi:hypothetical protein